MELGLDGKTSLVTGASRGIGAGVAMRLAGEGMNVALVARDRSKLEEVLAACAAHGVKAKAYGADLRDPDTIGPTCASILSDFGGLDLLVNNAGATKRDDFFKLTDADWEDGFALKFHGYVRMTRAVWPHLKARGGSIVNVIGIGGHAGKGEFTIGGSVNAALYNFTKSMSEVGRRDGVRVNAVNPGRIKTDRLLANFDRIAEQDGVSLKEAAERLRKTSGIERFGEVEDIAAAVAFLASQQAGFVQGSLFDVDGGENMAI
jgi:3-oxoacyl-[acyl-carrier protein] reductase